MSRAELRKLVERLLAKGYSLSDISRNTGKSVAWLQELLNADRSNAS